MRSTEEMTAGKNLLQGRWLALLTTIPYADRVRVVGNERGRIYKPGRV
jgi:hypothetical protein